MARSKKTPKKKSPPAKANKPKKSGPQMGIGDFMQQQFEQNAGKKPKLIRASCDAVTRRDAHRSAKRLARIRASE
jgi:hypothetical protein